MSTSSILKINGQSIKLNNRNNIKYNKYETYHNYKYIDESSNNLNNFSSFRKNLNCMNYNKLEISIL